MIFEGLIERKGHGGCRRIAVLVEGHHYLVGWNAELLADTVEDALVGLMRNVEVDLVGGVARHHERFLDHARDFLYRMAKNLAPVHAQMSGGLGGAGAAVHVEKLL